jgi:hypothetical protein
MVVRGELSVNSSSLSPEIQPDASLLPEWRQQVQAWRDLLAQCARKPSRKRIHALRSLTLRLRVGLKHRLPKHSADSTVAHAFRHWCKEGKKLRKALEPLRDADVYLARLDSLRTTLKGTRDGEPQLSPRCLRQIDKLECRLKRQRDAGTDKLKSILDDRGKCLNRVSTEMETALAPHLLSGEHSTGQAALKIFSGLAGELPDLDSANLHAYRRRLKHALYLAEISAASDPLAARLAAAFRKIHLAAGEWHDWQALALEAARVLPGHGKQDGLVPVLEAMAEKALKRAVGLSRRSAALFLKRAAKVQSSTPRKPVAADAGFAPGHQSTPLKISA